MKKQYRCLNFSRSHDGKNLLCCSWDGTVAYLGFEENELGYCFNSHEKVIFSYLTCICFKRNYFSFIYL